MNSEQERQDVGACPGPRARRLIMALFAAVIVIFPAQYYFAKAVEEPYPALVMPAFVSALVDESGRITAEIADITVRFDDGGERTITMGELLGEAPSSHRVAMARQAFLPRPSGPPPEDIWGASPLKRLVKQHIIPGRILAQIRGVYWTGVQEETKAWMRSRLGEMFPGRHARAAEITWSREVYTITGRSVSREREKKSSVEVGF